MEIGAFWAKLWRVKVEKIAVLRSIGDFAEHRIFSQIFLQEVVKQGLLRNG